MTTGWKLDRTLRADLLRRYPPRYPNIVADHVTLRPPGDADDQSALPGSVTSARIIGRADDDKGVEAMVVAIDGSTARPDGGTWHITWSLTEGRRARESNDVIAAHGYLAFEGVALTLVPARW